MNANINFILQVKWILSYDTVDPTIDDFIALKNAIRKKANRTLLILLNDKRVRENITRQKLESMGDTRNVIKRWLENNDI
jgi:hypothetical protein